MESCSVVSETLNCECEVKDPQDLYVTGSRKYGITVGHVLHVISSICMLFLIGHGGVIEPTLTGLRQYSQELPQGDLELHRLV